MLRLGRRPAPVGVAEAAQLTQTEERDLHTHLRAGRPAAGRPFGWLVGAERTQRGEERGADGREHARLQPRGELRDLRGELRRWREREAQQRRRGGEAQQQPPRGVHQREDGRRPLRGAAALRLTHGHNRGAHAA